MASAADLSGTYEVVLPITLNAAEGPITDGTVELGHDDAATFLARGFVREPNDRTAPTVTTQPVSPTLTEVRDTGTPPVPGEAGGIALPEGDLVEVFGADTGGILSDAGYATVAEVQAATDEVLIGIDGIGPKRLEGIREALQPERLGQ